MELKGASVRTLKGNTYQVSFHCGRINITIIRDNNGKLDDISITTSLDIPCFSQLDVISKLVIYSIKSGANEIDLINNMYEMMCFNKKNFQEELFSNCLQCFALVLKEDYENSGKH